MNDLPVMFVWFSKLCKSLVIYYAKFPTRSLNFCCIITIGNKQNLIVTTWNSWTFVAPNKTQRNEKKTIMADFPNGYH